MQTNKGLPVRHERAPPEDACETPAPRSLSKEMTGRVAITFWKTRTSVVPRRVPHAAGGRPMSAPLSRYLKDFSAPKLDLALMPPSYFQQADAPVRSDAQYHPKPQPEPKIDIEAERQSAYGRGRDHAEAELAARHAEEIAVLRAAHAAELAALALRLQTEAAETIHHRFGEMGAALANLLTTQTAQVLAPILTEQLTGRAIADLATALRLAIGDGEGVKITVRGPEPLFTALAAHFPADAPAFRHVSTEEIDLTVEFGESILMTRLSAWADSVRKVLA